jgi:hypothetical protein
VLTLSFNSRTLGTVTISRATMLHSGDIPSETPFFILSLILPGFKDDLPSFRLIKFFSLHAIRIVVAKRINN